VGTKFFKKRRTKLPSLGVVPRLIRRLRARVATNRYEAYLNMCPTLPLIIREVTLARMDPHRRSNIMFYPDLKNFLLYEAPNRSLPIDKFLNLFRGMLDQTVLDKLIHDLTNFRLEIYTQPEDWIRVYADDTIHSCMSGHSEVRCYCHPNNKLALAALYAPGSNTVVARTIVNTEEKWYVRLFGDALLVQKLNELGYRKLDDTPREFRMYAQIMGEHYDRDNLLFPYFDFNCGRITVMHDTANLETRLVEIVINASDPIAPPPIPVAPRPHP
jgi:hypothetical protein